VPPQRAEHGARAQGDGGELKGVAAEGAGSERTSVQRDLAIKPTTVPIDSAYSDTFSHNSVLSVVTPVSSIVADSPGSRNAKATTDNCSQKVSAPLQSKERTDALLHQVDALKHALNISLEKRRAVTTESGQLALNFEASIDLSQQTALDATSEKWRANLQQSIIETEHEAYSERIRALEGHVLKLQAHNQALKAERAKWLPPAISLKVEQNATESADGASTNS